MTTATQFVDALGCVPYSAQTAPRRASFTRMCKPLAVLLLVACSGDDTHLRYSGTVQAPSAAIGSTIGGRVTAVFVQDGAQVRAGDVVARLDDAQERALLANAIHDRAAAAAALADLRAGTRAPDIARAKALAAAQLEQFESLRQSQAAQAGVLAEQVRQARSLLAEAVATSRDADIDGARATILARTGDASAASRDAAVARAVQARAQVAYAQAALRTAGVNLANATEVTLPRATAAARAAYRASMEQLRSLAIAARPDAIRRAQAQLDAAGALVANARAKVAEQTIRAPAAGTISAQDVHVGDVIAPGAAVATVNETGKPYVRVFIPQSQLARFDVGGRVDVYPDTGGQKTNGTIEQIDTQAQFTPQNVETADDRAHLSFGVKVRIDDRGRRVPGGTTAGVVLP